ncbi:methyl-accepting chemotaxis protein [Arenicella sp.]|nr:methyl-accepting chemotaxis protein [Arenicella sp.]
MNDSTIKPDDLEDLDLDELLDSDQIDGDFQDFEGDEGSEASALAIEKSSSGRVWMIIAIISFALALLSSLLLAPLVSAQLQRVNQSTEIIKSLDLTAASAAQALTEAGTYQSVELSFAETESFVDEFSGSSSFTASLSDLMFGNGQYNTNLNNAWLDYESTLDSFISSKDAVAEIKEKLSGLNALVSSSVTESIAFADAVAKEGRAKTTGVTKDKYLFLTAEASNLNGILGRVSATVSNYYSPTADIATISDEQNGLMVVLRDTLSRILGNASEVVTTAAEPLQARYDALATNIAEVSDRTGALVASRNQLTQMGNQGQILAEAAVNAQNQSSLVGFFATIINYLPIILALLGAYALWRFSKSQSSGMVQNEMLLEVTLAEQQESILKLLDEMSALADGDLTVEAEVTDQITGAIADSVNYAVIEMRDLVSQINRASLEVANESASAVQSAQAVSQSNTKQAEEISEAATLMQRVTNSMREMSQQANTSASMAAESMNAANQGTKAVRDTIKGMEDMREQIQDTSKRIKRLGESSQRIGDIVALIDDIAEQTNILSLNAAIQASMAGEAGRGFAVVSDEVQGLAERSTEATKKIAALVATIQNDTNDAVLSMEKATQQVVAGTKVADTAGSALSEIEDASKRLSELINQISKGSNEQADVVTQVTDQVNNVSKSSVETSRKSQDSANSIAKLLELAKELESSVTRFKLPVS